MKIRFLRVLVLGTAILWLAGCANSPFYHGQIMRGQVVQSTASDVVVCVGKRDGAEPGQLLSVYRVVFTEGVVEEGGSNWRRAPVGTVKIENTIDDHFAKARVIEGDIVKNDIVELQK